MTSSAPTSYRGCRRVSRSRGRTTSQVSVRSLSLNFSSFPSSARALKYALDRRLGYVHALRHGPLLRHTANLLPGGIENSPLPVLIRHQQGIAGRERIDGPVHHGAWRFPAGKGQENIFHRAIFDPFVQPRVGEVGLRHRAHRYRRGVVERLKYLRGTVSLPSGEWCVPRIWPSRRLPAVPAPTSLARASWRHNRVAVGTLRPLKLLVLRHTPSRMTT